MRVIFLDIDGVLVTARILKQPQGRQRCADDACVAALNRLLEESKASLVISSLWRFCGLNKMKAILEFWSVNGSIIGITPDLTRVPTKKGQLYEAVSRGHEIQAWLDEHPEVSAFVILDDEADMEHLSPYLVKTEFERGLTFSDAEKAVNILCGPSQPGSTEERK
jgi:hypothetical protein